MLCALCGNCLAATKACMLEGWLAPHFHSCNAELLVGTLCNTIYVDKAKGRALQHMASAKCRCDCDDLMSSELLTYRAYKI